jgi:hypothetical protein
MGIYTSADIRYGVIIPEDTDEEQVEKLVEDVDGLEVVSFGEYDWPGDIPTFALVLTDPKVSCGEMAVEKFTGADLSVPAYPGGMDVAQNGGQKIAADLWDGDWTHEAGYLLVWSRG